VRWKAVVAGVMSVAGALVATQGVAAAGSALQVVRSGATLLANAYVVAPFANGADFSIEAVVPTQATGGAPTPDVDGRSPWVAMSEAWPASMAGVNSTFACESVGNVQPISADMSGAGLVLDVHCDDGNGFAFYRVTWTPTCCSSDSSSYGEHWWNQHFTFDAELGQTHSTWARVQVCGYDGTAFHCVTTPDQMVGKTSGDVWGNANLAAGQSGTEMLAEEGVGAVPW
jgi:hypothetical protein